MESVQAMKQDDGKKQVITGICLILGSAIFLTAMIMKFSIHSIFDFIFFVTLAGTGMSLIGAGYSDWLKGKGPVELGVDQESGFIESLPRKMYLQMKTTSEFEADLYDFSEQSYSHVSEQLNASHKVLTKLSQWTSNSALRPAHFTVYDQSEKPVYLIEKKGGFGWRSYVKRASGEYVAYTTRTKNRTTGQTIYKYIEHSQEKWVAEGDHFIGHMTLKDADGNAWAVMKRGAINTEVPESFQSKPGSLMEWNRNEQVPHSLLAFMFIIQFHDSM
ncbi:hypothetical protein [Halobacillus salinus]|uniref:Uncharacterized protein n=1 Tax=Halobacillus salinus TaxID=192814 RepID=A0A4Z0GYK8_9BACI|nr:hypothetical protein [Halobacillus salinus]TGB02314.1 hypothetical protein E4663_13300 [Halobacillus salinus]